MQRVDPVHRCFIHRNDQIAGAQICFRRRSLRVTTHNLNRARNRQIQSPDQSSIQRAVAHADSEVSSPNTTLRQDFGQDPLCSSGWHCEAYTLSHRNNRGVHTHYPAARIHQRPARIARVECRRVLNHTFDEPAVPTSK